MSSTHTYCAPNIGSIVAVLVSPNEQVDINQPLVIIEAMQMQTTFCAAVSVKVRQVFVILEDESFVGMPLLVIPAACASYANTEIVSVNHNTNQ